MIAFTYMKESKQPAFGVAADQLYIVLGIANRFVLLNTRRDFSIRNTETLPVYTIELLLPIYKDGRLSKERSILPSRFIVFGIVVLVS